MIRQMSRVRPSKLHLPAAQVYAEIPGYIFDTVCSPQDACDTALAMLREGANVRIDVISTAAEMMQEIQARLWQSMLIPLRKTKAKR